MLTWGAKILKRAVLPLEDKEKDKEEYHLHHVQLQQVNVDEPLVLDLPPREDSLPIDLQNGVPVVILNN